MPHKLWICVSKVDGKILRAHCTYMPGISQTCNHVAVALFSIEAAVRMGLNIPSCTTACSWLPKNKAIKQVKIKDLKLGRSNFGRCGQILPELNSSPKTVFDATKYFEGEISLEEVAGALKQVCSKSDSILFTALLLGVVTPVFLPAISILI